MAKQYHPCSRAQRPSCVQRARKGIMEAGEGITPYLDFRLLPRQNPRTLRTGDIWGKTAEISKLLCFKNWYKAAMRGGKVGIASQWPKEELQFNLL